MTSDTHAEEASGRTSEKSAISLTATTESSWMVVTGAGNGILGHLTQDDDRFTAYDAQELRIGEYATRDDAVDAVLGGTS